MKSSEPIEGPIESTLLLADISGFTQLLYQASRDEKATRRILATIQRIFSKTGEESEELEGFAVINTTGDGFLAISKGGTPSRTALEGARIIAEKFDTRFKSMLGQMNFRSRVDLRIGLHHGFVYRYSVPTFLQNLSLYNSDDINLLSRVTSSRTARTHGVACTRIFMSRLLLRNPPPADEIIDDRSVYPEPIEVYKLPKEVPPLLGKASVSNVENEESDRLATYSSTSPSVP